LQGLQLLLQRPQLSLQLLQPLAVVLEALLQLLESLALLLLPLPQGFQVAQGAAVLGLQGRLASSLPASSASRRLQATRLSPSSSSLRRRGSASSPSLLRPKPSWPPRCWKLPPVMAPLFSSSSPSRVTARQRPSSRRALTRSLNTSVSPNT